MKGAIQRVEYEYNNQEERTDILLFVRTEYNERKKVRIEGPFDPYFYTTKRVIEHGNIKDISATDMNALYMPPESTVYKVSTKKPADVGRIRSNYRPHFEGDIIFSHRFLIDSCLKYGIEYDEESGEYEPIDIDIQPKVMYFDIETIGGEAVSKIKEAPDQIVIIGAHIPPDKSRFFVMEHDDLEETEEIKLYEKEKNLIQGFIKFVDEEDPDILSGKNLCGFDLPYLKYRSQKKGANFNKISPTNYTRKGRHGSFKVSGRDAIDWENYYKFMKDTELESNRMHDILEDELGWEPVGIEDDNFEKCWNENPHRLLKRNRHDIEGPAKIDNNMGIIRFFNELRKLVGCRFKSTKYPGTIADIYYLRELFDSKYVAPSKTTFSSNEDSFSGAAVLEPRKGRWEDVVVVDLSSAYPSLMRTFNISPETYVTDERKDEFDTTKVKEAFFRNDIKGIIPRIQERLLEERDKKKELMYEAEKNEKEEEREKYYSQQYAIKQLSNSFYGVLGDKGSRYYQSRMAEGITSVIRNIIEYIKQRMEEKGYKVIAGDTDSVFVKFDGDPNDLVKISNNIIDEFMEKEFGVEDHLIKMDLDKQYEALIIREKKLYAGRRKSGKLEKKGIASRRSDTAPIARELQEEMLKMMLAGEDKDRIKDYLSTEINRAKDGEVTLKDIGVPTRFSKDPKEYGSSRMRSKIWKKARRYLNIEFEQGDKPKRVISRSIGRIAAWEEDDLGDLEIDYRSMVEEYVKPKIEPFLHIYGLNWDKDIEGQKSLADWMPRD